MLAFQTDYFAECERWIVQLTLLCVLACHAAHIIATAFKQVRSENSSSSLEPTSSENPRRSATSEHTQSGEVAPRN